MDKLLCCAKASVDIVGEILALVPDDADLDKDMQLLQMIDQHFNNPKVKQKDWDRLHALYHDAVKRIAKRLSESEPSLAQNNRLTPSQVDNKEQQ